MEHKLSLSMRSVLVVEFDWGWLFENGSAVAWELAWAKTQIGDDGSTFFVEKPDQVFGHEDDEGVDEFGKDEGKFLPGSREFVLAMRALAEEYHDTPFLLKPKEGGLQ